MSIGDISLFVGMLAMVMGWGGALIYMAKRDARKKHP
ncbi:hypothetical protein C8D72_0011 [Kushneria indalinina DSM 14324]|uniref:Uncharacterized protein n=1 Tax=Kushneria indalinina DSM 14324 TaxID=1122140 RepID=A0A3D9E0U3_9GAMM|nr:hypothetical protein C8D72_0011 [Kushneria indalinina DSM 14324]